MRYIWLFLLSFLPFYCFGSPHHSKNKHNAIPVMETIPSDLVTERGGLSFDKIQRDYIVQKTDPTLHNDSIEKNITKEGNDIKYPAIILLHPANQTAQQVLTQSTLSTYAKNNGYYIIAPNAFHQQWNDGKKYPLQGEKISQIDDVGFLMVLIDRIVTQYPIDSKKIFIVGASNGGFMATHFICKSEGLIRAGASVGSTLIYSDSEQCSAKNIPWLSFNGGDDKVVPFEGQKNKMNKKGQPQETLLSAEETFDFLNSKNRCLEQGNYKELPHLNKKDPTQAFIKTASRCSNNTKNVLLAFKKAGHQWPGTVSKTSPFSGLSNQDVDAGKAIITYFNHILQP